MWAIWGRRSKIGRVSSGGWFARSVWGGIAHETMIHVSYGYVNIILELGKCFLGRIVGGYRGVGSFARIRVRARYGLVTILVLMGWACYGSNALIAPTTPHFRLLLGQLNIHFIHNYLLHNRFVWIQTSYA